MMAKVKKWRWVVNELGGRKVVVKKVVEGAKLKERGWEDVG